MRRRSLPPTTPSPIRPSSTPTSTRHRVERPMAHLAMIVGILAVAGALVSWVAGAVFYLRSLRALSAQRQPRLKWLAVVAWPFARSQLKGEAGVQAGKVNKALV